MPERNEAWERGTPEGDWKSLEEGGQERMQTAPGPDELRRMVQSRETLNARLRVAVVVVTVVLAGAFLCNVYRIEQPWIRFGQAWTLGVVIYLFSPAFERRRRGNRVGEPCVDFLVRQHEERREGYLRLRNRLFLLIPGIGAWWWGRGAPVSWPFGVTLLALSAVWLALGMAAEKAARERDELAGMGS